MHGAPIKDSLSGGYFLASIKNGRCSHVQLLFLGLLGNVSVNSSRQVKVFGSPSKDFATHAKECDALLQHYTQQFRDREIYWMNREYSRAKEGLVSVIIDSYDKAKLSLPRFPFGRVPKKSIYEETRRAWASSSFLGELEVVTKFCFVCLAICISNP